MAKVTRQIRLDPILEQELIKIAEKENLSFSNCVDWLLSRAVEVYFREHDPKDVC